jgi:CorA-like Mg2+ transporter protein
LYRILAALTDSFFPVLETIDDELDRLEEAIIAAPTDDQLARIFRLKRALTGLRRVVVPARDLFQRAPEQITGVPGLAPDTRDYFRDVYNHLHGQGRDLTHAGHRLRGRRRATLHPHVPGSSVRAPRRHWQPSAYHGPSARSFGELEPTTGCLHSLGTGGKAHVALGYGRPYALMVEPATVVRDLEQQVTARAAQLHDYLGGVRVGGCVRRQLPGERDDQAIVSAVEIPVHLQVPAGRSPPPPLDERVQCGLEAGLLEHIRM